jgi:hypothetical protein
MPARHTAPTRFATGIETSRAAVSFAALRFFEAGHVFA